MSTLIAHSRRHARVAAVTAAAVVASLLAGGPADASTDAGSEPGSTVSSVSSGAADASDAVDRIVVALDDRITAAGFSSGAVTGAGAVTGDAADLVEQAAGPSGTSEVVEVIDELNLQVVEVPAGEGAAVLAELAADGRVKWAELDVEVRADVVRPNDALWGQQWGPQLVGAGKAWTRGTGSRQVTVAVLDSGVDARHPDLEGAVLPGRSFVAGVTSTADDNGHGTSAAGIIAARGGNRVGVAGMCWSCQILPVKVLDSKGSGTMSGVAQGLIWAADQGARVASLSLSSAATSRTIDDAVAYANAKGMLVVASAGNTGKTEVRYPAGLPGVLAVAGSTSRDQRYDWSTHGGWVDIAAPGCNATTRVGGSYANFCGTSSAAPLVAGAAALAFSAAPTATPAQVRDALERSAKSANVGVRTGRMQVDAAIERLVRATAPVAPAPAPAPAPVEEATPAVAPTRSISNACPAGIPAPVTTAGVHSQAASCLDWWEIGIFPTNDYRSGQALTRAQFAATLDRMLNATGRTERPSAVPVFRDVAGHPHQAAIERLSGLGVILGYSDATFAPDAPIRRDQMATLMARVAEQRYGLSLAAPSSPRFRDVPATATHAAAVGKLAVAGITTGVDGQRYDPAGHVTRGQTASFVARLLDLLVAEGAASR
ncbi:S8 family serine peptidase [Egicoccus sp. AB-alg6-2]|uniref:S8 family serine peptidase n=1 Tax=Egicoccus sp. AB-alg6-2 TaxID=3242692 RepID=UPI00359D2F3A